MNYYIVRNATEYQIQESIQKENCITSFPIYTNGSNGVDGTDFYSLLSLTDGESTAFDDCCIWWTESEAMNIAQTKHFMEDADDSFYKIYFFLNEDAKDFNDDPTIIPKSIDYKKSLKHRLHPKMTFKKGLLVKCEYFENIEQKVDAFGFEYFEYSNPILKCLFEYHVDSSYYVSKRVVRRYWQTLDNVYCPNYKESIKYYDTISAREEGLRRRQNIINKLVIDTGGLLVITEPSITSGLEAEVMTLPLLTELNSEIDIFVKGDITALIDRMSTIDASLYLSGTNNIGNWLDNTVPNTGGITIRQIFIGRLYEGTLIANEIISNDE